MKVLICDQCLLLEYNLDREGEFHTAQRLPNGKALRTIEHNGEVSCAGILRVTNVEPTSSPIKQPALKKWGRA